jgi:hypothetical protein
MKLRVPGNMRTFGCSKLKKRQVKTRSQKKRYFNTEGENKMNEYFNKAVYPIDATV